MGWLLMEDHAGAMRKDQGERSSTVCGEFRPTEKESRLLNSQRYCRALGDGAGVAVTTTCEVPAGVEEAAPQPS
jgi:hypothetical protein